MPNLDLFATRLIYKIQSFVSTSPDDMAIAVDAMLQNWDQQDLYTFPHLP